MRFTRDYTRKKVILTHIRITVLFRHATFNVVTCIFGTRERETETQGETER